MFKQRSKKIAVDIIKFLCSNGGNILIEVVDKKYQLCVTLMEYFLISPYLQGDEYNNEGFDFKKHLSEFIYDNIEDKFIENFVNACSTISDSSTEYIEKCFEQMKLLCNKHKDLHDALCCFVQDSKDIFDMFVEKHGVIQAKRRYLPLPDTKKDNIYFILPNIILMANILARINHIEDNLATIDIIHDEQKEFDIPLEAIIKTAKELSSPERLVTPYADFQIFADPNCFKFQSSRSSPGVQFADILAGTFMRLATEILNKMPPDPIFLEAFRIVRFSPMLAQRGANLVLFHF